MAAEQRRLTDLIETLRADQSQQWRCGKRILIESYSSVHPEILDDPEIALQLVYNEILLREGDGERTRSPQIPNITFVEQHKRMWTYSTPGASLRRHRSGDRSWGRRKRQN